MAVFPSDTQSTDARSAEAVVTQSCLTLWDPMNCSPPVSSIPGIFQARILESVAISFSRGSSQPRDQTWVSCIADRRFTIWATGKPFLTEHSKNSSYLDQNSPQYCYRGLLSGSVSNSVKFSSEFRCSLPGGKHLQVSTVQSIPKATALGSGEEWAWIFAGCLIYPLKTRSTSSKW